MNRILPIDADATHRHLKSLLALARASGVIHLISESDWKHAEGIAPVDLVSMASALGLPPEATVCWQRGEERMSWRSGATGRAAFD